MAQHASGGPSLDVSSAFAVVVGFALDALAGGRLQVREGRIATHLLLTVMIESLPHLYSSSIAASSASSAVDEARISREPQYKKCCETLKEQWSRHVLLWKDIYSCMHTLCDTLQLDVSFSAGVRLIDP